MFPSEREIAAFLEGNEGITSIDAFVHDICGNPVGKRLPVPQLPSLARAGIPISRSMQLLDVVGETSDPLGMGSSDGDPDVPARPLAGTLPPVPWARGTRAQVLCTLLDPDTGSLIWHEPRQVWARVLKRFEEIGLTPVVAVELELHLINQRRRDRGAPSLCASPLSGVDERQGHPLSLEKTDGIDPLLGRIRAACEDQGLPVTSLLSENSAGQFEMNLGHQPGALRAGDHAALLRRAVRSMARHLGIDATFMAKPFTDQSGNGLRVHLSLSDAAGQSVFDPEAPDGDAFLDHAIAVLQATMHEAVAIFSLDINGYRRLAPNQFTPMSCDWGENNRSVAIRLPLSRSGRDRRLEHRVAAANANPYLVIAAVLAGVHRGIATRKTPSSEAMGNTGHTRDTSLPATLWDALRSLGEAKLLPDDLGRRYTGVDCAVKAAELDRFLERISGREYRWYL